jgi:putative heme-binding domain-containing protein
LVAGGMRNPFGLAFNEAGDLFTYDADMEWDVGLPWYHPTRVLHLVPGGDYGWRRGTGVLPVWTADTLPSAVDIGVGSPTAVQFGTKSHFPPQWRDALYILDWAYGRILAVHLKPSGPSYEGRAEPFISGRPLNVTGIDFGPDGAMYFTTGGRRTQSGLYRVSWSGADQPPAQGASSSRGTNRLRYDQILERLRQSPLDTVWAQLASPERWTRYAARVALEERPLATWADRALAMDEPESTLTAALVMARIADASLQPRLFRRLLKFQFRGLPPERQLDLLRVYAVSVARRGLPPGDLARNCLAEWESHYPNSDARVNQSLCELLVRFESAHVVRRTVPLLATAVTQNEKMHYLLLLRGVKAGWTTAERRTYFEWLVRAGREFHGANTLPIALKFIRKEAEATLAPAEMIELSDLRAMLDQPATPAPLNSGAAPSRKLIKDWTIADLADLTKPDERNAKPELAQRLFHDIGCAQCHRFGSVGGVVGPDLSSVGSRFDRRALLESIIEPSKVVAEVYRTTTIITRAGDILEGRVLSETDSSVTLGVDSLDFTARPRVIAADQIESRRVSDVSSMPAGLLNTLNKDEIVALLTWLEAGPR